MLVFLWLSILQLFFIYFLKVELDQKNVYERSSKVWLRFGKNCRRLYYYNVCIFKIFISSLKKRSLETSIWNFHGYLCLHAFYRSKSKWASPSGAFGTKMRKRPDFDRPYLALLWNLKQNKTMGEWGSVVEWVPRPQLWVCSPNWMGVMGGGGDNCKQVRVNFGTGDRLNQMRILVATSLWWLTLINTSFLNRRNYEFYFRNGFMGVRMWASFTFLPCIGLYR